MTQFNENSKSMKDYYEKTDYDEIGNKLENKIEI